MQEMLITILCFSVQYIGDQYKNTAFNPLQGVMPYRLYCVTLIASGVVTQLSDVSLNIIVIFYFLFLYKLITSTYLMCFRYLFLLTLFLDIFLLVLCAS